MNRKACAICLGLGLFAAFFTGCAALPKVQDSEDRTTSVEKAVTPLVEQLYLNQKALRTIYLDLRSVTHGTAFMGDDTLLNYLQKACLYIDKAQRSAHSQWDLLSLFNAIRREHVRDYFTLRTSGLEAALFESSYDLALLMTYQAFINQPTAHRDIERAIALIRDNQNLYAALIGQLEPLAHPRGKARLTL